MGDARQKDMMLLLVSIQLSIFPIVIPELYPLVPIAGLVFVAVLASELSRRANEA